MPPRSRENLRGPSPSVVQATETEFAIEFSETELAAGTTTFAVTNEGEASPNLVVASADGKNLAATEIAPPGGSCTVRTDAHRRRLTLLLRGAVCEAEQSGRSDPGRSSG